MTMKLITLDPTGLDLQTNSFFFEDEKHNVYFDALGTRPALCDECDTCQKVDSEGYFYCPNNWLHFDEVETQMKCHICDKRIKKDDIKKVLVTNETGWSNEENGWVDTYVYMHDYCLWQTEEGEYEEAEA